MEVSAYISPADLPGRALTSYPWQPTSGEPSRRHAWSWAAHGATQSNTPDLDCAYGRVTDSPIATQKDGTSTNKGTETLSRNGGVQDDGKLTRFVPWHAADHRDQPRQISPSQRTSTPHHATAERSAPPAEGP
ncbi:hypothetical protein Purlil1_14187 [Purpureocillium lilacinum]|uniref:Uncharacterized protein n=1 Tax=Purpureocillium lilacinum TaxID=33203 RepID=A0ABR0BC03_PURLI|nr:hypothetical protein Purlil1_14187 [Purpureocillium lilacinum]